MPLDPAMYGDELADIYDLIYPPTPEDELAAKFVAERTLPGGRVLEFGVGTGRVALPMADCGLQVHGIDASKRMLDTLVEKAGSRPITVQVGDFTSAKVDDTFDTALIALNTLFMVPSQDGQIAVLENVAEHLRQLLRKQLLRRRDVAATGDRLPAGQAAVHHEPSPLRH
jgi:SAM-dependent methyltransferase